MSNWTIFSNHGHVLVCLARDPEARLRDVAADVGLTERAVQKIVRDLQESGMIIVSKHGRRNRYRIDNTKNLRHDLEAHCTLGELVGLVVNNRVDKMSGGTVEPTETEAVEFSPAPALSPVAVPVPKKEVEPKQVKPAVFEPVQSDKSLTESPAENEPKTTKPSKPDSKTKIERQQGSLF